MAQFEDLAKLAFKGAGKDYAAGKKLTLSEFLTYADASPTTTSWVAHFDDIPDAAEAAPPVDKSYELPTYPARTEVEARLLEGLPVPPNPAGAWHKAPEAKGDELDAETGEPVHLRLFAHGVADGTNVSYLQKVRPFFQDIAAAGHHGGPTRRCATPTLFGGSGSGDSGGGSSDGGARGLRPTRPAAARPAATWAVATREAEDSAGSGSGSGGSGSSVA